MTSHPQIRLQDIYKSCFQERFGVSHALAERNRVEEYIIRETASAERFEEEYTELCGIRGDYVRINLKAVRDGKVTATELAEAFMASYKTVTADEIAQWRVQWAEIEHSVRQLYPALDNFESDSQAIAQMLERGEYAVHHSKAYNEAYAPHYRIVSKEEYNKLKYKLK